MQAKPGSKGDPRGELAIVSGGSSGIGLACAAELVDRGCRVALLARDAERLSQAREALLASRPDARVIIRSVDVGDPAACAEVVADLVEAEGPPGWVVASAGIAMPGKFLEQPLAEHERHMRTNYHGAVNLVHACVHSMAACGCGRIVLVSSAVALAGIYGYAAYAASKFALRGLGEVLRVELAACGVSVTVAYPSDTDTPQHRTEQEFRPAVTNIISKSGGLWAPERVARAIVRAAERGRFYVGPGVGSGLLYHFGCVAAPILRNRQIRIAREVDGEAPADRPADGVRQARR